MDISMMGEGKDSQKVTRVFIWGLMGAGKSTLGRKLARRMQWNFVDTDAAIVRDSGRSIPEIFHQQGEAAFRSLEMKMMETWKHMECTVFATGGGLPCFNELDVDMRESGLCILLRGTPAFLATRLRNRTKGRPLLGEDDHIEEKLLELWETRKHIYETAHLCFDQPGVTAEDLATAIEGYSK